MPALVRQWSALTPAQKLDRIARLYPRDADALLVLMDDVWSQRMAEIRQTTRMAAIAQRRLVRRA